MKDLGIIDTFHIFTVFKGTVMQIEKHWQMIANVFQKYTENFIFELFIISQQFSR